MWIANNKIHEQKRIEHVSSQKHDTYTRRHCHAVHPLLDASERVGGVVRFPSANILFLRHLLTLLSGR